jgi:hypothetical protein
LYDHIDPTRVYFGTDTRASSILLGGLFATAPLKHAVSRVCVALGRSIDVLLAVVVGTLGVAWALIDGPSSRWLFHGGLFGHSFLAAGLVAVCARVPSAVVPRLLGVRPLLWLGGISYSLYLWHWPVYVLLSPTRTGWSGWPLLVVRVAVSVAAAVVSKHLLEDPLRYRSAWTRSRQGAMTLAGSTMLLVAFWVVVPKPDTAPASFDVSDLTTLATSSPTEPAASTVPAGATTGPEPASTSSTAPPATVSSVLLLGDSVADDESPGLIAALEAAGLHVHSSTFPGAGLLSPQFDILPTYRQLLADVHPDLVLYQLSLWDVGTAEQQRSVYASFTDLALQTATAVAFITPPPLRDGLDPRLASLPDVVRAIVEQHPGRVFLLDSEGAWGTTFRTDMNGDGAPERKPDGVHVCPAGAARMGAWLVDALASKFSGVTPAPVTSWATGPWIGDARYNTPEGSCAALR